MAIKYQQRFDQARPAGFDGVFEWDFLRSAFRPTKIEPMDFDAVVERHGHFLLFETKEPGRAVPTGQRITLEQTILTGRFTVFLLYGKTATTVTGLEVWHLKHSESRIAKAIFDPCDAALVVEKTRLWFEYANANPVSTRKHLIAARA